jgi:hypothetical protein
MSRSSTRVTPAARSRRPWVAYIADLRDKLHQAIAGMQKQGQREEARQRRRITGIKKRQRKLLDAYLADSLPAELLQEKQRELAAELANAEHHLSLATADTKKLRHALDEALDLAADCERAYPAADGQTRRQFNQALFDCFKIDAHDIDDAPLTEEFALLLDPNLPRELASNQSRSEAARRPLSSARGSNKTLLAEREGFEPSSRVNPDHAISSRAP